MQRLINHKNDSGMTLVEILVSLVILGLVLMSVFPLVTQSLQVVNLSNTIATQLFSQQDEIEVVAVTKDGAFLEDGTFIPVSSFSVFTGDDTTWVAGMTVEKDKLVRFIASRLGYRNYTFNVIEGYTASEGTFVIEDDSIEKDDNYSVTATDKQGNYYNISSNTQKGSIEFTLPTDSSNRFTNYGSPYLITVTNNTTNETQEIATLFVRMPKAVIAGSSGLLISSSNIPSNWVQDGSSTWVQKSKPPNKINDIVNIHNSADGRNCFVAAADGGRVYIWKEGSNSFENVTLPAAVGTRNLNDIILVPNTVLIVGDGGLVIKGDYQFTDDDMTWTWSVVRSAGSGWAYSDLNAIAYKGSGEYYLVGDKKMIIKYAANNFQVLTSNNPSLGSINGKRAVILTPDGDYLQTSSSPVSGNSSRTIFMVVRPDKVANISLFTMAASNSTANQFLTLRTDSQGRLAVQSTSSNMVSSNLQLSAGTAYIISCRYDNSKSTDNIILSLNGTSTTLTLSGTLNTSGPIQLGSDSLTPVTDTSDFSGYIGDVFLSNKALRKDPFNESYLGTHRCAPEMDIVTHYLSVKYSIGTSIDKGNKYFRNYNLGSPTPLNDFAWARSGLNTYWEENDNWWPYRTDTPRYDFSVVLWLDAFRLSGERIATWTPRTWGTSYNFTVPALNSLNAVACYDSIVIAGGEYQNLFKYDTGSSNLSKTNSISEYSFEDMLFVDDKIIALVNNPTPKICSIRKTGESFEISSLRSSNSTLNDIYAYDDGSLLLVTGNNGTILYSEDKGATWSSSESGTSQHLYAGCIR
ncbi:MAG: prepilin-type N-terminal cleavage/methylation domain-containing protein [Syntrophomonadaceae bacterium]|nr:prepilin-type N-terminal cleavage/methylation domain-containing protein [Syntrophomonadaceae bacterium]